MTAAIDWSRTKKFWTVAALLIVPAILSYIEFAFAHWRYDTSSFSAIVAEALILCPVGIGLTIIMMSISFALRHQRLGWILAYIGYCSLTYFGAALLYLPVLA